LYNYLTNSYLEFLAAICTIVCVWLNIRQNIWGWLWAIISSSMYGLVLFKEKLYSDMELQAVFIGISVYGWWRWWRGTAARNDLVVRDTPIKYIPTLFLIFVGFTGLSGYLHQKHTDASLPYIDAALTGISIIAQWLMARKYLENWLLWIAANIAYVGIYMSKGLYISSILYIFLFAMAIKGYLEWRRSATMI
jgi:nicotinamide mononucleotide transporter